MASKGLPILVVVVVVAVMASAVQAYKDHQAYTTGIYIGKAAFRSEDFQNRRCVSLREHSSQDACTVSDLTTDSAMETALASANIIPALADSIPLHTGFRDGWRESANSSLANR